MYDRVSTYDEQRAAILFFHPPKPDRGPETPDRAEAGKGYEGALTSHGFNRRKEPAPIALVGGQQQ